MHFYESSIITTKDGLHCQVYGNEHPKTGILVKPKYIPTEKVFSDALDYRFISGKKMNRLNLWKDKKELNMYIEEFKKHYPHYVFKSPFHESSRLFFHVPISRIERIYFPRRGLKELMAMPEKSLDPHLKKVCKFVKLLMKSGLETKDLGVTYSTLMGHYLSSISDINIVVYGKEKFWRLMQFLETAEHPNLRWKTTEEWTDFYNRRNRAAIFEKEKFVKYMSRKKSEGYFDKTLFIIFGTEKEKETWFKWGEEKYESLGMIEVEGVVEGNFNSVVRPGCYEIKNSRILRSGNKNNGVAGKDIEIKNIEAKNIEVKNIEVKNIEVKKVVFYSRDYCMLAVPGEKIRARGMLELVKPTKNEKNSYYRVVIGYFDSYVNDRRENEYIKVEDEVVK